MATKTTVNISPKVLTGLLTGLGTAALLGIANAVDGHTFDFLGPWSAVAYPAFTVLIGQAAAWLKKEHDDATAPAAPELPTPDVTAVATPTEPLVPPTADQIINGQ